MPDNIPQKMYSYKLIKGTIRVETGLHIGGSSDTIEIGGMDNPVIVDPLNNAPYIPGSSLKGKMRSLLEWKLGKIIHDPKSRDFGQPYPFDKKNKEDADAGFPISRIFGTSADDAALGPTRLIVRDARVSSDYEKSMLGSKRTWTYNDMLEEKYENSINRITARANPRPLQRVVTGAEFSFEMVYRIFDMGDDGAKDRELFALVLEGLRLIELDALGGAGSRGCGKVSFHIELPDRKDLVPMANVKIDDIKELSFAENGHA